MLRVRRPNNQQLIGQTNTSTTNQGKTKRKTRRFKKPPEAIQQSNTVNLSNKHLNPNHISALSKGLSFCPTPRPTHPCHILRDTFLFNRRVRLKHHFFENNTPSGPTDPYKKFKPSSGWTPPPGKDLYLDCFLGNIVNKVHSLKDIKAPLNLTPEEYNALIDLKTDPNIIIKPADKGGATVVLNRIDYISEANRQLSNPLHYAPSRKSEFDKSAIQIKNFLTGHVKSGHLPPYAHLFLTYKFPRIPLLYLLPKIHKRDNPGRPIISAVGGPTEKISAFVDSILRPLVVTLPSFVKNTTDFLLKIQHVKVQPHHCLLTIDVSSLYTNIPHIEGLKACRDTLLSRTRDDPHTWFVLTLLRFVLTLNYFEFDDKFYHQISGTAMGTKLAPNYANIFMGQLESKLIDSYHIKPLLWLRFIDDIFCVFLGNLDEAQKFIDHLNSQHPTIKFTAEISNKSVNFLDTTITVAADGSLTTTLYRKPADTFKYLHYRSFHPTHQKRSIPYSQFVRVRRICTFKKDFINNTNLMIKHLLARGYPMKLLIDSQNRAAVLTRDELLKPNPRAEKSTIRFITTYSSQNVEIQNIIKTSLFVLDNSRPRINHEHKFLVTSRRCPNFRDLLTKAKLPTDSVNAPRPPRGSSTCSKPRCSTCQHIRTTTSVRSHAHQRVIPIPVSTNCMSTNIIYIIECSKCSKQYVGQTSNTLTTRLRQHLRDIRLENIFKPVAAHFNEAGHTIRDVSIYGVDAAADLNTRLRLEEAWIHVIGSSQPAGLNLRF